MPNAVESAGNYGKLTSSSLKNVKNEFCSTMWHRCQHPLWRKTETTRLGESSHSSDFGRVLVGKGPALQA